jgi:hypothetical protein
VRRTKRQAAGGQPGEDARTGSAEQRRPVENAPDGGPKRINPGAHAVSVAGADLAIPDTGLPRLTVFRVRKDVATAEAALTNWNL